MEYTVYPRFFKVSAVALYISPLGSAITIDSFPHLETISIVGMTILLVFPQPLSPITKEWSSSVPMATFPFPISIITTPASFGWRISSSTTIEAFENSSSVAKREDEMSTVLENLYIPITFPSISERGDSFLPSLFLRNGSLVSEGFSYTLYNFKPGAGNSHQYLISPLFKVLYPLHILLDI